MSVTPGNRLNSWENGEGEKVKIKKVSVDRLTLVGFKVDYKLETVLHSITTDVIERRCKTQYPFDWQYNLVGGGVLQIGSLQDQSNIRIDFNPNNSKGRYKEQIKQFIGCMKYVKPTRIDVAIDLQEFDMNDYTIIDDLSRKTNSWNSGSGRLETHYIGAPTSDLRLRIYDKALEQGEKGDWWRIEAQMRREFAERYDLFNPFENITLVKKEQNLSHIENFKEKIFLDHLLKNPDDLSRLAKNTRTKYKKILKDLAQSDSISKDFNYIYDDYKNIITNTLEEYIQESYINNVIIK